MPENKQKIRQLAQQVRQNPEDSFSKFALALELLKNNQVEKALKLFESVYQNDPEYLGVYYHLGKLHQALEHFNRAENLFHEGIRLAEKKENRRTLDELTEALESLKAERSNEM